jgi:hypothetical protein
MTRGDHKQPEGGKWKEMVHRAKDWGLAEMHDSMNRFFRIGGSTTRTPGQYPFKAQNIVRATADDSLDSPSGSGSGFVTDSKIDPDATPEKKPWYSRSWSAVTGLFKEDVSGLPKVWTCEVIHPSVRIRMMKDKKYDPPALRDFKLMYDATRGRWTWVKRWTVASGQVHVKKLHEYRIEHPSYAQNTVTTETLASGVGQEFPLPPREKNRWWFWLW